MWPWKARASSATRKKLTAFLDEGSEFDGKYTFTGTVLLNGKFLGEIASPDTLIMGASVTAWPTVSAMFSSTSVANPGRVKVTV